jgi:Rhodopirellula transposase DDE domain
MASPRKPDGTQRSIEMLGDVLAAQFRYINAQVTAFQADGSPVISVDAKKKENVGNFKNGGAEWAPAGQPERVSVHDFADEELGKAVPYGICDLTANTGWVNVGLLTGLPGDTPMS